MRRGSSQTDKADFLHDADPVFGLVHRGEGRAYPQQILVWHEIVNDTVGENRCR